jgi:peptidyl-prolyl cis-trans isomerase SurA
LKGGAGTECTNEDNSNMSIPTRDNYRIDLPMPRICASPHWWRRRTLAIAIAIGFAAAAHSDARAQQVTALVNGEPITALDIAHRQRFTEISTRKSQSRQEALDELIEEKLKLSIAKRYTIEITERDIDNAFGNMARRAGLTAKQFADALTQAGVSVAALRMQIKADIAWTSIIRGKFAASLQVGERDVMAALESRKPEEKASIGYDYVLRPILFIVPGGSSPNAIEARLREAEGLKGRFQNCEEGIQLARTLLDVAVRDPIRRSSVDLPQKQREVLDGTPLGHLTPPDVTQQGIEMFAICSKQQASGDTPGKRAIRDEMVNQRYQAQAKRFMQELRRGAMIEIR